MQIEVVDIHNTVVKGIKKAWLNHFIMTDERDEDIKPEYLTSASVCYAFSEFISTNSLNGRMTVRAEEQTGSLWRKILLPAFMRIGSKAGLKFDSSRKGNIDISLEVKGAGILEIPFGVIENKGFLSFTQKKELYVGSMNEVKKDLERNIEFVSGQNSQGVEYSCFTFYLRDKESVLTRHGAEFCQSKRYYFEKICNDLLSNCTTLSFAVEIETLEEKLFNSDAEANEPDENGCPAYTAEGTWHIIYGAISIYRTGKTVTYNKSFNTEALKHAG